MPFSILFLAHYFIYSTWTTFRTEPDPPGISALATVALLAISFVTASLLAFRYANFFVRLYYRVAAVWLGTVNFLFLGACLCWLLYLTASLAAAIFALAPLAGPWGILNARDPP